MYDSKKTSCNVISVVLVGSAWTKALPFNSRRVAILLPPNAFSICWYSFTSNLAFAAPSTPGGITVAQNSLLLTRRDLGDAIQQELYASTGNTGATIAIHEFIEDPCDEVAK